GAVVERSAEPLHHERCRRGWYQVKPRGYVCLNHAATLDPEHPVVQLATRELPHRGLPYDYVIARYPPPPLYARLPSEAAQRKHEGNVAAYRRKHERLRRKPGFVPLPPVGVTPPQLASGEVIPGLNGVDHGPYAQLVGRARVKSGFALLGRYDHGGRPYGLTTGLGLIPLDRTRVVAPSPFRGIHLSDELPLPIGIVVRNAVYRRVPHPESGGFAVRGVVPFRSALGLTGVKRRHAGDTYWEVRDGSWLRADDIRIIRKYRRAPQWAERGRTWIDVSILRQTLVAYEGRRPVYATLVSTGIDGIADHEDSHATIQGTFLIHTKHRSVTMDSDERGDAFDLRDVPYVQYFTEGYALHGAYWHDDFGRPRSHGCVNLSPLDAAWLFHWSEPRVPEAWHAALSLKQGTYVYIHP
ncbi:MAG: L,D-transpeptidase, partial [Myxococcota bacterium]